MTSDEITSLRTALRYARHGDDPAKRRRLTAILATMAICAIPVTGLLIFAVALIITALLTIFSRGWTL